MFKLIRFFKGYRLSAIMAPLFKLMEALFELIIPLVVAQIIDVGIYNGDTAYIIKMGGVMLILGALGLSFSLTCQYLAARASLGFGTNLRKSLFNHINKLSYSQIDKFGTSSLVTRLTSDINQAQGGASMFIRLVLRAPFIAVGAIVMAMIIDVKMASIFVVMAIAVSAMLFIIMTKSTKHYKTIQTKLDNVSSLTRSSLEGARVVRAFGKEQEEQESFNNSSNSLAKSSIKVSVIATLLNPLSYAIINLSIIALLWFGGKQVYAGALKQGQIIALVNYLGQILLALVVTANLAVTFTKATACANRVSEVLNTVPAIADVAASVPEPLENAPQIALENVSFSYSGSANSLNNININIAAGETVGIIGATGSGKSTLINILPRFYDATEGEVKIYGHNVKAYPLKYLREIIAVVPQKATLFSGTVRENIAFGKLIHDDEIINALKASDSYDFIFKNPDGLDGRIERGGANFSGGQKQRLTIARALAVKPQVLIFDDSFSALDYLTSAKVTGAIKNFCPQMTVLNVSQRATSLQTATKIIVMDNGNLVGCDTHANLIKSCGVYREIVESQAQKSAGGKQ